MYVRHHVIRVSGTLRTSGIGVTLRVHYMQPRFCCGTRDRSDRSGSDKGYRLHAMCPKFTKGLQFVTLLVLKKLGLASQFPKTNDSYVSLI